MKYYRLKDSREPVLVFVREKCFDGHFAHYIVQIPTYFGFREVLHNETSLNDLYEEVNIDKLPTASEEVSKRPLLTAALKLKDEEIAKLKLDNEALRALEKQLGKDLVQLRDEAWKSMVAKAQSRTDDLIAVNTVKDREIAVLKSDNEALKRKLDMETQAVLRHDRNAKVWEAVANERKKKIADLEQHVAALQSWLSGAQPASTTPASTSAKPEETGLDSIDKGFQLCGGPSGVQYAEQTHGAYTLANKVAEDLTARLARCRESKEKLETRWTTAHNHANGMAHAILGLPVGVVNKYELKDLVDRAESFQKAKNQ